MFPILDGFGLVGHDLRKIFVYTSVGVSVGNEEFQHAIRRYVQDSHTFKGYPMQVRMSDVDVCETTSLVDLD